MSVHLHPPPIEIPWVYSGPRPREWFVWKRYIERAAEIAREHHGPVERRYTGESYFGHVQRVAQTVGRSHEYGHDPEVIAAAYLHDILEDTDVTTDDLDNSGVTARTVEIVLAMTKRPGLAYNAYLQCLSSEPEAWVIKRADMMDNMATLPADESSKRLWRKYIDGIGYLHFWAPEEFLSPFARTS